MKHLKTFENFTPKKLDRDIVAPIEYKQIKYWLTYSKAYVNSVKADEHGLQTEPVIGSIEDLLTTCQIYGINKKFEAEDKDFKTGDSTIYTLHIKTKDNKDIPKELKKYIQDKL